MKLKYLYLALVMVFLLDPNTEALQIQYPENIAQSELSKNYYSKEAPKAIKKDLVLGGVNVSKIQELQHRQIGPLSVNVNVNPLRMNSTGIDLHLDLLKSFDTLTASTSKLRT